MTPTEIMRAQHEALIRTFHSPCLLRSMLEDRSLDNRLKVIGVDVFDPDGLARALIAARDYLEAEEARERADAATMLAWHDKRQGRI